MLTRADRRPAVGGSADRPVPLALDWAKDAGRPLYPRPIAHPATSPWAPSASIPRPTPASRATRWSSPSPLRRSPGRRRVHRAPPPRQGGAPVRSSTTTGTDNRAAARERAKLRRQAETGGASSDRLAPALTLRCPRTLAAGETPTSHGHSCCGGRVPRTAKDAAVLAAVLPVGALERSPGSTWPVSARPSACPARRAPTPRSCPTLDRLVRFGLADLHARGPVPLLRVGVAR